MFAIRGDGRRSGGLPFEVIGKRNGPPADCPRKRGAARRQQSPGPRLRPSFVLVPCDRQPESFARSRRWPGAGRVPDEYQSIEHGKHRNRRVQGFEFVRVARAGPAHALGLP